MTPLINHLWQSTIVLAVVWGMTKAWQGNRAALRYGLWLAASIKFLLPFDALVMLGRQFGSGLPAVASLPMAQVVELVSEPFSHSAVVDAAATITTTGADTRALPVAAILLAAWAVGFLPAIGGWGLAWLRTARVVKHSRVSAPGFVSLALARVSARRGQSAAVQLAICDTRVEPGVFGIWRPVLLWPRALTTRLSEAEIEAIVAHELCHVQRRDNLTGALHKVVSSIFWFYPVVGLIGRQLRLERERACDEEVIRSGYQPRTYAEGIVKTCEFCIPTQAMTVTGATGNLCTRVVGILRGQAGAVMGRTQRLVLGGLAGAAFGLPLAIGAISAPHLRAEAPAVAGGSPAFEVASVKVSPDRSGARGFQATPGGRVNLVNLSLRELIFRAYQTQDHLVIGGPGWISVDHFDIVAKAAGSATPPQMLPMVRTLLADRFKLVMHRETREMPIYNLVLARGDKRLGDGLKATTCVAVTPAAPTTDTRDAQGRFQCGINRFGAGQIVLTGNTLDGLANRLGSLAPVGRSVVNRTGLEGRFDVSVEFTAGALDPAAPDGVALFTALQEQLGLKLEAARGPVEVLVIDSVEKPQPD